MECSICKGEIDVLKDDKGKVVWSDGHNAEPINDGRCCTKCNDEVVITRRIEDAMKSR